MRITFLGTGTPIVDRNRQGSATLIELKDERLLIDAGRGVTTQLLAIGVQPQDIDAVFITHHHVDHIGSLGEFLLSAWHNGRRAPLIVHGPSGTSRIVAALLEQVYARDLAFARLLEPDEPEIRKVVEVRDVTPGIVCAGSDWQITTELVDHGHSLGLTHEDWPCLGYRLEAEGKVIAFSGDAVDCAGLDRLARHADLLIQCCYLAEAEIVTPAFRRLADHVIASSGQVGKIAARNQVRKLMLTHIRPKSQELMASLIADVRADYEGEVGVAEDLMVIEM